MVGICRRWSLSLGVLACSAGTSLGSGWSIGCAPASSGIYAPAATPYFPSRTPPANPNVRTPMIAPIPKAKPVEPSRQPTTLEPPVSIQGGPKVIELRSLGNTDAALAVDSLGRCKVGFWNITGRDVTLTVNGQSRALPKDRAVTLYLERNFTWQVTGRDPQAERVAENLSVYELVLRP